MRVLRGALVSGAAAAALVVSATTPASAVTAASFTGTASINCFGCGSSSGNTASLWMTGVYGSVVTLGSPGYATFEVVEAAGATCFAMGYAVGTMTVSTPVANITSGFWWTRVGGVLLITLPDLRASGVGAFKVTSPVGVPCGGPVEAQVAGVLGGV